MSKYVCPVCGFNELKELPFGKNNEPSYEICPCCGFEFGFDGDNDEANLTEYRKRWIAEGTMWFNQKLMPKRWNYKKQLENLC